MATKRKRAERKTTRPKRSTKAKPAAPTEVAATKTTPNKPASAKKPPKQKTLQIPKVCPRCGSTNFKPMPEREKLIKEIAGTVLGFKFRRVIGQRKKCQCGQMLAVRTYIA